MTSIPWASNPKYITHLPGIVAGVTFLNGDGSSRQAIIQRCNPGEQVFLVPEPDNCNDPNAIAVLLENDEQIGYLPKNLAARNTDLLRLGYEYVAFIADILAPDGAAYDLFGVRLLIVEATPGHSDEDILRYIDSVRPAPERGPDSRQTP